MELEEKKWKKLNLFFKTVSELVVRRDLQRKKKKTTNYNHL